MRTQVVYTTPVFQFPACGGNFLRVENSIKALAQVADVHLIIRGAPSPLEAAIRHYNQYCASIHWVAPPPLRRSFATKVMSRTVGMIYPLEPEEPRSTFETVLRIATKLHVHCIWLGYGNLSYPLLKYLKANTPIPVVNDTDSVWSLFLSRSLPYVRGTTKIKRYLEASLKSREEQSSLKLADITTVVSQADGAHYEAQFGRSSKIRIFSNGLDTSLYSGGDNESKNRICITGSFWPQSPMSQGAQWFLKNILPRVRRQIPSVHVDIVGRGSDSELDGLSRHGVSIHGRVGSVVEYLKRATVAVVPLHFESGTRLKILEAGACKLPVVSTPLGAEGLAVRSGTHLYIAQSAETFSEKIIDVLKHSQLAAPLGQNLYDLVHAYHSLRPLSDQADIILRELKDA